tara:strand:- start:93 stop:647 length:555 start_codon:yes stop_codon:yes gene_type:complete
MDIPECNYINPNKQNAKDMNLNCVSDPLKGEDKYCKSEYKLYDPIAQRSSFLNIRRDIDAGYSIKNYTENSSLKYSDINNSMIEGFTGKIFITPDNTGERTLKKNKCPQGYTERNGICEQICMGCKYEDNMKSQEFNEFDNCFPQGVYDGRNNDGSINCTCGKNNQYCSEEFLEPVFNMIGMLL